MGARAHAILGRAAGATRAETRDQTSIQSGHEAMRAALGHGAAESCTSGSHALGRRAVGSRLIGYCALATLLGATAWPRPAAANGVGTVFVTHERSNTVTIVEHVGNTVLTTLAVGGPPSGVTFTGDGRLALVANGDAGTLSLIDRDLYQVTGSVRVGGSGSAVAAPVDESFWITADAANNRLVVHDAAGAPLRTMAVPGKPIALATGRGPRVYALVEGSDQLAVFDARTGAPQPSLPLGGPSTALALSPDGATAFVSQPARNAIAVVDTAAPRAPISVPLSETPAGLALGPENRLYVAVPRVNSLFVVDIAARRVSGRIPVGNQPQGVGVSTEQGAFAYVANSADDSVSVVDLTAQVVVKTIAVGTGPGNVTVAHVRAATASPSGAAGRIVPAAAGESARPEAPPIPRDLPNTGGRAPAAILPRLTAAPVQSALLLAASGAGALLTAVRRWRSRSA